MWSSHCRCSLLFKNKPISQRSKGHNLVKTLQWVAGRHRRVPPLTFNKTNLSIYFLYKDNHPYLFLYSIYKTHQSPWTPLSCASFFFYSGCSRYQRPRARRAPPPPPPAPPPPPPPPPPRHTGGTIVWTAPPCLAVRYCQWTSGEQAYKRVAYGTNNNMESVWCPQDSFLFPRQLFLDIARRRTSLSLVWCAKQNNNNKTFKHQWPKKKKKGRSPLLKSQIKTYGTQRVLALTRRPLRSSDKNKRKKENGRRESLSSERRVLVLFRFDKRKPRSDPSAGESFGSCVSGGGSERRGRGLGEHNRCGAGWETRCTLPTRLSAETKETWESRTLRDEEAGLRGWRTLTLLGKLEVGGGVDYPHFLPVWFWSLGEEGVRGRRGGGGGTKAAAEAGPRVRRGGGGVSPALRWDSKAFVV